MEKCQIDKIQIHSHRRRQYSEAKAKELAESIKEIGLLHPIVITTEKVLVSGLHRLEACKLLGWQEIDCIIRDYNELDAELAEIDENLIRAELTVLERAEHLKKRKEIYEAKYPEAKAEERKKVNLKQYRNEIVSPRNSFTADTANKLGVSPRTIQQEVQIAEKLADEVKEAIKGTELEDSKKDLLKIARLEPEEQKKVANVIITKKVDDVDKAINIIKKEERIQDIERQKKDIEEGKIKLPEGVFEVIVVDPPWPYGTQYDPEGRRAANPYPEMSLEQIKNIKLPAAESCVLFLWTTHKFMRYSFEILDTWGFREVAIITWVKDRMGLGTWLRSQSEFCIMAVKGNPKVHLTNQTTVIYGPMREHSRKPDEFYKMVDELCIGRKLDYFSRQKKPGWETFGNDVEKFKDGVAL